MLKANQFSITELKNYYFNNETLFFTCNAVQQLNYSENAGYYFTKIASVKDFCPRGRYHAMQPENAKQFIKQYAS